MEYVMNRVRKSLRALHDVNHDMWLPQVNAWYLLQIEQIALNETWGNYSPKWLEALEAFADEIEALLEDQDED